MRIGEHDMDLIPKKKLGFGLMRLPTLDKTNAANVDLEQVCEMVDLFLSGGFTYFDTAWMYQAFASESVCPQHLHIVDYLKDVAKHFEVGNQ